jgi:hypothetical protein
MRILRIKIRFRIRIPNTGFNMFSSMNQQSCLIETSTFVCRASMHSFFIECQSLRELRITRNVYYVPDELPVLGLEEPPNEWEVDSEDGDGAAGEARGPPGPARATDVEQEMEEFLRIATPDIPALFPRPAWDLSCRLDAGDMARRMDDYGAEYLRQDQAEAEYRARREQAKVWRRERDEDLRHVLEARALQDGKWGEDLARRVDLTMENEEEESRAEERRVKETEREQLEQQIQCNGDGGVTGRADSGHRGAASTGGWTSGRSEGVLGDESWDCSQSDSEKGP